MNIHTTPRDFEVHQGYILSDWWFGCHQFHFPINIGFLSSSQLTNSDFSEGWPNHQLFFQPIPPSLDFFQFFPRKWIDPEGDQQPGLWLGFDIFFNVSFTIELLLGDEDVNVSGPRGERARKVCDVANLDFVW